MCIDAPESTTNSLSSGFLRVDGAGGHQISGDEKNAALSCSFNLNTLLAGFHAASRAPCSCHSVSSWDRSSNFGALGLRWWGSPGQIYPSEGFWSRIVVWRAIAFVNFTRWIGLCMFMLFRRIDFGGFMSWKTQPKCRAFDDRRPVGPRFNSWWQVSRFISGRPDLSWLLSRLTTSCHTFSCQPFLINMATALLSSFFLYFLLVWSSTWRCAYEHLSTKFASTLGLVEQAFWRVPLFTEWIGASSFEVILAKSSRHSTAATFFSGVIFHAYWYRGENCNCLLLNNLQEFFVHAVLSPDSWPRRFFHNFHSWRQKFLFLKSCSILRSSSICDNQVLTSSDESPGHTIPIRSWVSQTLVFLIRAILPRCHQVGFSS